MTKINDSYTSWVTYETQQTVVQLTYKNALWISFLFYVYACRKSIPDAEVTSRLRSDGKFDVTVTATVPEVELSAASVFDCEMTIPNTNYKKRTSRVYFPEGTLFFFLLVENIFKLFIMFLGKYYRKYLVIIFLL